MGKDHLGEDMRKVKPKEDKEEEKEIKALDEKDIALLKSYGQGQYTKALKVGFEHLHLHLHLPLHLYLHLHLHLQG